MKTMNICIAGLGNVGSNLINTLTKNKELMSNKSSLIFNIQGISAKNFNKKRNFNLNDFKWVDNPMDLLKIKNCSVLIELIGEEKGISYELIKKALENKINVITANKALLAKNGTELFHIAEKNNVLLLFEAAVAAGIPIIKTIKNNIFLNRIKKISGILNGTTNYILTTMFEKNLTFSEALSIAKSKGYTSDNEAKLDIGGVDSAHKLTLLASLCYGSEINFKNNDIHGIYNITISDIINADKLGYKIKLISESYINNEDIYCVTGPKLINKNNPLANVDGVLNAVKIETDLLESLFLEGEGAGGLPTASSIISDLHEISSNTNIPSLGFNTNNLFNFKRMNYLDYESCFYLSIITKDMPGVLSQITKYFNELNISIEKILQVPENKNKDKLIPIIIFTHKAKKNNLIKVIKKIENLDFVLDKIVTIPIEKDY